MTEQFVVDRFARREAQFQFGTPTLGIQVDPLKYRRHIILPIFSHSLTKLLQEYGRDSPASAPFLSSFFFMSTMSEPTCAKDEESTLSPHFDLDLIKSEDELGSVSPPQNPLDFEPTDGGLKAWSTVLGASLVGLCTFG